MRLASVASRLQRGDLVWLSWVPDCQRHHSPSHGSTLLMLTPRGAAGLLARMPRPAGHPAEPAAAGGGAAPEIPRGQLLEPSHFDVSLVASLPPPEQRQAPTPFVRVAPAS